MSQNPVLHDAIAQRFTGGLSDLGAEYLLLLKEATEQEPEIACVQFGIPRGNLAYILAALPKKKSLKMGSVGGLPYSINWIAAVDEAKSLPESAGDMSRLIQEVLQDSRVPQNGSSWRIRSLLHGQRHWTLAREMCRTDFELASLAFGLPREAKSLCEMDDRTLSRMASASRNLMRINRSIAMHLSFAFNEAQALDQVVETYRFAAGGNAIANCGTQSQGS